MENAKLNTDIKTAYEMLTKASHITDRLEINLSIFIEKMKEAADKYEAGLEDKAA